MTSMFMRVNAKCAHHWTGWDGPPQDFPGQAIAVMLLGLAENLSDARNGRA